MISKNTLLVGCSGKKRSGKDTFLDCVRKMAAKSNPDLVVARRAFADKLKEECAEMLARQWMREGYRWETRTVEQSIAEMLAYEMADHRWFSAEHYDNPAERMAVIEAWLKHDTIPNPDTGRPMRESFQLLIDWWSTEYELFTPDYAGTYQGYYDRALKHLTDETLMDYDGTATVKDHYRWLLQWWGTEFRRKLYGESYWLDQHDAWIAAFEQDHPAQRRMILIPDMRFENECAFVRNRGGYLIRVTREGLESRDTHPSETALDGFHGWDAIVQNRRRDDWLDYLEDIAGGVHLVMYDWKFGGAMPSLPVRTTYAESGATG